MSIPVFSIFTYMKDNELDIVLQKIMQEKGGKREDYFDLMNQIAYHESAGTLDPKLHQYGGGPGRGIFQFEEGVNAGGKTAANRTIQFYKQKGITIPQWLKDTQKEKSVDVSNFTKEQQEILFLGNMRGHPKADFSKVWNGEEDVADFWANYHWAGDDKDRNDRINSFRRSQGRLGIVPNQQKKRADQYDFEEYTQLTNNEFSEESNIPDVYRDTVDYKKPDYTLPKVEFPQPESKYNIEEMSAKNNIEMPDKNYTSFLEDYINVNKLSFGGFINQFEEGGEIESNCGGPGQPPCLEKVKENTNVKFPKYITKTPLEDVSLSNIFNETELDNINTELEDYNHVKQFTLDYINSPEYKKKLISSGYKDVDKEIEKRYKNVQETNHVEQFGEPSFWRDLSSTITGKPYTINGSVYRDDKKLIILDYNQAMNKTYKGTDTNGILAHEYGHAETKSRGNESLLNEYDIKNLTERLKPTVKDSHSLKPSENKADLNALRYQIQYEGFDPFKDLKIEDLDNIKNSFIKNRLLDNYSKEDLIWLMNNIASNDKKINTNVAAFGGNLNGSNMNSNGFTEFNEGGTHEENPHGGIPMGIGSNGIPNTVEEGETSFSFKEGKYIFSNRLKL